MLMNVGEGKWLGGCGVWFYTGDVWFVAGDISSLLSGGPAVLKLLVTRFKEIQS